MLRQVSSSEITDLRGANLRPIAPAPVLLYFEAGGEPSTQFPPERLVEQAVWNKSPKSRTWKSDFFYKTTFLTSVASWKRAVNRQPDSRSYDS